MIAAIPSRPDSGGGGAKPLKPGPTQPPASTTPPQPGPAAVFKNRGKGPQARQPIWLKRDKFARHGEALLLAARGPSPLERCLGVLRLALGLMADVLRQGGPDPDDRPVSLLGHHHITVRYIGQSPASSSKPQTGHPTRTAAPPSAPSASSTAATTPAAAAGTVAPARHVAGSFPSDPGAPPAGPRVHVQELASFDAREGPKALLSPGGESNPLLTLPAAEPSFATFTGSAHVAGGQQQPQTSGGAAERQWVPGPQPLAVGPRRLAVAHFRVEPDVAVKAKRLGRDVKVKVRLEGGGEVVLLPPPPSAPSDTRTLAAAAGAPSLAAPAACSPDAPATTSEPHGCTAPEVYRVVLPALVMRGALMPHAAELEYRGDLEVTCAATGLSACLTFKEGGVVKGLLERQRVSVPAHSGSGGAGGGVGRGGSGRPDTAAAALSSAASVTNTAATAGGGTAALPFGLLGNFSGSLREGIRLVCPALGQEGVVYEEPSAAQGGVKAGSGGGSGGGGGGGVPPLTPQVVVDLASPGPRQLPRLWACLHDALMYADPNKASGGKAAEDLTRRLALGLRALFSGTSPGAQAAGGGGAQPAGAAAAAAGGSAGAGAAAGAGGAESDEDPDFEAAAREDGDSAEDPRDVPPSIKAQHAAGRRLNWQLHYTVVGEHARI